MTTSDMSQNANPTQTIAHWLDASTETVAFTGAGISTESGIPDFRSPGGVWSKSRPVYFDEFVGSADARFEYWKQKAESHSDFRDAQPNVTHNELTRWESTGMLRAVITQNIDGLHQQAGSQNVLELHGTAREISCLDCGWRDKVDSWVERFLTDNRVPDCPECGGMLKHATISFGQSLPADVLQSAREQAIASELFFAMGSSLVVEPAASLPVLAKHNGARLVIMNRDPTPLDTIADLIVNDPLGETMSSIKHELESLAGHSLPQRISRK